MGRRGENSKSSRNAVSCACCRSTVGLQDLAAQDMLLMYGVGRARVRATFLLSPGDTGYRGKARRERSVRVRASEGESTL